MSTSDNSFGPQPNRNGGAADSDLVARVISNWRTGQVPDARAFLAAHPQLADQKSLVLDLAYEEYCLRKENGESITASTFCDRFPDQHRSLARLLDVHEYLDQHPQLAPVEEEIQWPRAGDTYNGFEIERRIGSGAFARVYLARELELGRRPVALKLSRAGTSEAMTLGRLSHPNVVQVNSVKPDGESGLTAICMPYLGEATLVDLLEAGFKGGQPPQSASVVLAVARRHLAQSSGAEKDAPAGARLKRQSYVDAVAGLGSRLAGALEYAHSHGVLHRDLKPSNVLLATDGEPMLLDFNLSWDVELTGLRVGGTVPYMSPEQVKTVLLGRATGKKDAIDARSDIYSLGVVLYELLTGVTPFGPSNATQDDVQQAEMLLTRQRAGARPVEELNPAVDASLGQIIAWCLQFDPADRPPSAGELEAALVRYQRPASRIKRALWRRRRWVASTVLAFMLAAAGIGIWLAGRPPFPERAYQAGLASYERGEWDDAIRRWTAAIDAGRPTAELLFARAMANQRRGKYQEAIADLELARRISASGAILATLAYCNAQIEDYSRAVFLSERSIDRGFTNAAVFNNLGFSQLQLGRLNDAIESLNRAIELDPNLAYAYHNRAIIGLRLVSHDSRFLPTSVKDIERAMELAPHDWAAQRDASRIFARSSIEQPKHLERSLRCLVNVLDLGGTLTGIHEGNPFKHLRNDADFVRVFATPQPSSVTEPSRVVSPCSDAVLR